MVMRTIGTLSFLFAFACLGLGVYRPEYMRVGLTLTHLWALLAIWATSQVILAELRRKKKQ